MLFDIKDNRRIMEKANYDACTLLHVAEECLLNREKRRGSDEVHDEVERALCQVRSSRGHVCQVEGQRS